MFLRSRVILGDQEDAPEEASEELRMLDGQLAVLTSLLRERLSNAEGLLPAEVVELSETLSDVHLVRFSIHEHLGFQRLHRLDVLGRGLDGLWRIADQDELLKVVCAAAVESCGFDRVMLSRISNNVWRPWRSMARHEGDPERRLGAWIRGRPEIQLGDRLLLETEIVRRREAGLVGDATRDPMVHAPLLAESATTSYVVAPIRCGERVVGLLHADYHDDEVTELDREVLGAFTRGLGRIFERAVLLSRLQEQRIEVLEAMHMVERALDWSAMAETGLDERTKPPVPALEVMRPEKAARLTALDGVLTCREIEVLALMATGATNNRIAQRLVIATETVKSHVKRILRKVGAENRAEAIAMYLRLSIGQPDWVDHTPVS